MTFLGEQTGSEFAAAKGAADLVVANNVFAHVPDIVDFAKGLRALMADDGTLTIEIPHLLRLIEEGEYDTIYHEHYSYLTLLTTQKVLATAGLVVVDVQELQTHGGSLRTWSMPAESAPEPGQAVADVLAEEAAAGLHTLEGHLGFATRVCEARNDFVEFLVERAREGAHRGGPTRPGQGQHAAQPLRSALRPHLVRRRPQPVQARQVPARAPTFPIHAPERIDEVRPDYIVILPWNLRREVAEQLAHTREWGAKLVVPSSEAPGLLGGVMKVVLFCGGYGMRMRSGLDSAPKPMIPIGDRPVLWHIMRYYAHFGHNEFVLCLGYGASAVKDYFRHYDETVSNDFVHVRWRQRGRAARVRHQRLEDHLRRHRVGDGDRRAPPPGAAPPGR